MQWVTLGAFTPANLRRMHSAWLCNKGQWFCNPDVQHKILENYKATLQKSSTKKTQIFKGAFEWIAQKIFFKKKTFWIHFYAYV